MLPWALTCVTHFRITFVGLLSSTQHLRPRAVNCTALGICMTKPFKRFRGVGGAEDAEKGVAIQILRTIMPMVPKMALLVALRHQQGGPR